MVRRSKGLRFRTRKLFRKRPRDRGDLNITKRLQTFERGDRVAIVIDPSFQRGQPHKRFHGLTGVIAGMQGRSYAVKVSLGDKKKTVISHPIHLKRLS
ncbi:MAG TPA: 50S ribosomal protein L21e [Thermoplasmata archaeon]|nr:50S ribosomal protein L21e [Thermoplasmata archaeon]